MTTISISTEVRDTLARNGAVVALESTIFSNLGLPSPANAQALSSCIAAIRKAGAVPAITAVIDGVARVGLNESEQEDGMEINEIQKGYMLNDRLLRPALVSISKKKTNTD